ncbi:YdhK family protein [Sporosarcina trichiuri]|uniref:YdhK family protein n=1 Tax=Sporosarcina trichiuri TaxID=3056445 RepID=UPI0025B47AED|nr:DUF1541 domain-containing protein [Sporosarcina sp. 0.2-SM1T-5]WJY27519.1 DUF1541 domain-containing protein [Sporosarcina sp. 0.2-SM1T-5]
MKKYLLTASAALALVLAGCASEGEEQEKNGVEETQGADQNTAADENQDAGEQEESGHEGMEHSSDGSIPDGLQEAADPKYPVGSEAIIETDHMPGMKGATATIVGAYGTTAYVITYEPTDGGAKVENHKWVIQEELEDAPEAPVEDGTEVTVLADHMKGMKGAEAVIETSKETTVYMIDYMPTDGGDEVKNHKWVTEDELSAKED